MPEQRAELTRWVIIGTRIDRRAQRRFAEIGSKEQDALDEFVIMVVISKSVFCLRVDSLTCMEEARCSRQGRPFLS